MPTKQEILEEERERAKAKKKIKQEDPVTHVAAASTFACCGFFFPPFWLFIPIFLGVAIFYWLRDRKRASKA